jgi:hypothetical protein
VKATQRSPGRNSHASALLGVLGGGFMGITMLQA